MIARKVFHVLLLVVLSLSFSQSNARDKHDAIHVNDDFFGIHIRWGALTTPWPFIRFNSWRVITPETEWRGIQPSRDSWNFEVLDRAVFLSERNKVDVILTLGQTPSWASSRPTEPSANGPGFSAEPRNLEDWERYIRTVVTRYRGRIKYYELWNEPYYSDLRGYTTKGHFSGSVSKMIELGKIVRTVINEVDPGAKLISPSCVGGQNIGLECTDEFLSAGGGTLVDVIGFHFYMLPERIPDTVLSLHAIMEKHGVMDLPLWNTESGYLVEGVDKGTQAIPNLGDPFDFVLAQNVLPGYVFRSMTLSALAGVSRYYHFSWDIPTMHVMWNKGLERTETSIGFSNAMRWLRGSSLRMLNNKDGVTSVRASSKSGHDGIFVWSHGGRRIYSVPSDFDMIGFESLNGDFILSKTGFSVEVGEMPILIRRESELW